MSIVKIMVFLPLGKQDILFYISLFPALSFRMKALPEIHLVSSSYCTRGIAHFLQSADSRFFHRYHRSMSASLRHHRRI